MVARVNVTVTAYWQIAKQKTFHHTNQTKPKSWVFNRNTLINLSDVIEIFYESKTCHKVTSYVSQ